MNHERAMELEQAAASHVKNLAATARAGEVYGETSVVTKYEAGVPQTVLASASKRFKERAEANAHREFSSRVDNAKQKHFTGRISVSLEFANGVPKLAELREELQVRV